MKKFAALVQVLATSTKTNDKLTAIGDYFATTDPRDKIWVIALFTGRRPRRSVTGAMLALWCMERISIPAWLFEESYHTVGDFAETIALLLPDPEPESITNDHSLSHYLQMLITIAKENEEAKKKFVTEAWDQLD